MDGQGNMDVDSLSENGSNIAELLKHWGIAPQHNLVADPTKHDMITVMSMIRQGQLSWRTQRSLPYPLLPVIDDFDDASPLVRSISSLTLPWTSSLKLNPPKAASADAKGAKSKGGDLKLTPLMTTSKQAVSVTSSKFPLEPQAQLRKVQSMAPSGPMVVAAEATGRFDSFFDGKKAPEPPKAKGKSATPPTIDKVDHGKGRVLVIGSNLGLQDLSTKSVMPDFSLSDLTQASPDIIGKFRSWAANLQNWQIRLGQIRASLPDNLRFLFNVMDWSIEQDALVAIRSKEYQRRPLDQLSDGQKNLVKIAAIALAPLLFIGFGLARWAMRRNRKRKLSV